MSLLTVTLALFLSISFGHQWTSSPHCCPEKEVTDPSGLGGIYNLKRNVENRNILPAECRDGCVYEREGYPGKVFCFKPLPPHAPTYSQCKIPGRHSTSPRPRNPETPPPLEVGQTRIIMSWPNKPDDLDLHVVGFLDPTAKTRLRRSHRSFLDSTFPDSTLPDSTIPDSKFPDSKFPESTFPDSTFPDSTFQDSTYQDSTFPDSKFPDSRFPDSTFPDSTFQDSSFPDYTFPDYTFPDYTFPDYTFPDYTLPDFTHPDYTLPENTYTDNTHPYQRNTYPELQEYTDQYHQRNTYPEYPQPSTSTPDGSPCRVYYGDTCGCPHVCLDVDNTNGGSYGPETVTLQNSLYNAKYTYAIGVHDYKNELDAFGFSQAKIEVTNGTTWFSQTLPTGSLPDSSWWFFGCISISAENIITYHPAPTATIFSGSDLLEWAEMANKYCNFTVMDEMMVAADRKLIFPPKK